MTGTRGLTIREQKLSKEQRHLAMLKLLEELRQSNTPTWPDDFAQRCGYTDKRAIRGTRVYEMVRAYGVLTAPGKMGAVSTAALKVVEEQVAVAADAAELAALRAEVARLRETTRSLETSLAAEKRAHEVTGRSLATARAMVDALSAHMAGQDVVVARDIESSLHALASEVTGLPTREVQKAPAPGARALLTALDGGTPAEAKPPVQGARGALRAVPGKVPGREVPR